MGRVRSRRRGRWKILKTPLNSAGYPSVNLCDGITQKKMTVHRLVATAFIPPVPGKPDINHIDGSKVNNRVDNLEWCSSSENTLHAYRTGLKDKTKAVSRESMRKVQPIGSRVHAARSSHRIEVTQVSTGETMEFPSVNAAARFIGCQQGNLSAVINGRIRQTAGYTAKRLLDQ